jgi:hypothetical protein
MSLCIYSIVMYYKCVKFHKNPISGLGGVALTRYMDGRTDRVIPIYPPNFVCRGYKHPAHGENSRHRHHTINMLFVICHDIAVPQQLKKIWFFGVKPCFFIRNTPTIFAPPSARRNFFKCTPSNLKSCIRPWWWLHVKRLKSLTYDHNYNINDVGPGPRIHFTRVTVL